MSWSVVQADRLAFFDGLEAGSVDLVFGSPPYEAARTYGIDFKLRGQDWVDWMVATYKSALRICKGLVAFVLEGQTRKFRWSAVPALLMADLHRAGIQLRKPPAFARVGIPGSGGPDWLRNDYEFIVCATNGGKLPWSENTAMGHKPKWAPGGEMSNRKTDGKRRNQWGGTGGTTANRMPDGKRDKRARPSHKVGYATAGHKDGDTPNGQGYDPPTIANPGNVIKCIVGGGVMGGDEYAKQNEAPFPEKLAEFFIRSFCPPSGIVADCFSGSGTTGAVAVRWGRRFVGCDVRESQVALSCKRIGQETPLALLG